MRILEEQIKIKYWFRYVDDIFALLNENIDPEQLLNSLNKDDKNIKFTNEIENEGILNFLDVKIMRKEGKFDTTVYRKSNSISEIIDNRCTAPYTYKIAALRAYINRAITICSSPSLIKEEIKAITILIEKSGCNKKIIKQLYKAKIKKLNEMNLTKKKKKIYNYSI